MTDKVKWGILGAAGIARKHVVPAMLQCELSEITAIASRSLVKAQEFAKQFSIPSSGKTSVIGLQPIGRLLCGCWS